MAQQGLIDPNLQKWVEELRSQKERSYKSRTDNKAVPWLRPPIGDWNGDLQTTGGLKDIHATFNTDKAEEALIKAFTPETPGNSADGIVLSLQIDYAAQAERAFRARTTQTFPRALAHYAVREKGHGTEEGALKGQALEYFTSILKQGSA